MPAQSVLAATGAAPPTLTLSQLDGSTTPTSFTLAVDVPGASSAKLVLDGVFVGEDVQAPLTFAVPAAAGQHKVKVSSMVGGTEVRTDAAFTAVGLDPADHRGAAHDAAGDDDDEAGDDTRPRRRRRPPHGAADRWRDPGEHGGSDSGGVGVGSCG